MMRPIPIGLTFICCILISLSVTGQSPYNSGKVLKNNTYTSDTLNGIQDIIIDYPDNGSLDIRDLQGNDFVVDYTPDSNYVGLDTFSIEFRAGQDGLVYEHFIVESVNSILNPKEDFLRLFKNSEYSYIDVVANDEYTAGPLNIDRINLSSNSYAYISNDSLYVKPKFNYTGLTHINYTLCDTFNLCYSSQLKLLVVDSSLVADDEVLHLQMAENSMINFTLTSDDYELKTNPGHGSAKFIYDNYGVEYTPFQNYVGNDTLIVSNDDAETKVIIDIIDLPDENTFVVDDYVYVHPQKMVEFDVFDNDIVTNASISYFSYPDNGDLEKLGGGRFQFVPDSSFMGTTSFEYIVCLPAGGSCETGIVTIYVDELNPENTVYYDLTTPKNRSFIINYDVPITNFEFDIIEAPENGLLEIYPGLDTLLIGCEEVKGYNLVLYTPDTDFIGKDTFDLAYCVDGNCTDISVNMNVVNKSQDSTCICIDDCVWPGDMNSDGRVDMKDLLSLGYNIGISGTERPYGSEDWFGQYCPDWNKLYEAYNVDLKHMDSDGDGVLKNADTVSISDNFGNVNTLLPKPFSFKQPFPIILIYNGPPNPEVGDMVSFDIVVGNEEYPAMYMEGMSFGLNLDPNTVDTSTVDVRFNHNSFVARNNATLELMHREGRRVDMGISRTDRKSATGYGIFATLDFVIEDEIDGIRSGTELSLNLELEDIFYTTEGGKIAALPSVSSRIKVVTNDDNSGIDDYSEVRIYPNPVSSQESLHVTVLGKGFVKAYSLHSTDGRQLNAVNFGTNLKRSFEVQMPEVQSGIYILRLETNKGMTSRKIVIH